VALGADRCAAVVGADDDEGSSGSVECRPGGFPVTRWRLGRHLPINVYGEPTPDWPEGRPICQCHHADDAVRIVAAINVQAEQEPSKYPDTKFLTLCTLEGRRVGAVTIGESRLPAVDVLGLIRAHGVGEAQLMWPQLTDDELAVLERLVGDLDARDAEDDDD
jgi:hypothetical protein